MAALFIPKTRSGPDQATPAGATVIQAQAGALTGLLASLASLPATPGTIVALKADLTGFELVKP